MRRPTASPFKDRTRRRSTQPCATILYDGGKKVEILGSYEPKLQYINEWWKQLYGESEGKQGKGIFPASVTLTADLHSMGQYIQDGERTLFETIISVAKPAARSADRGRRPKNLDGLNFLAGKRISEVNRMAELGVQLAHVDGGVPNIRVEIPAIYAQRHRFGLLYFFEKACGISGYILGVNPVRPARRGGVQEKYVRPAGQAGLRGGIESHQSTAVNSPGLWKCGTSHGVRD